MAMSAMRSRLAGRYVSSGGTSWSTTPVGEMAAYLADKDALIQFVLDFPDYISPIRKLLPRKYRKLLPKLPV